MRKLTIRNTTGSLAVSADVVREIAENAITEVEGVAGLANPNYPYQGKIALLPRAKEPIQVKMNNGVASVKVAVYVTPDAKADLVAEKIQKDTKLAIQSMTGIAVTQVDVMIVDVLFDGE